ncbi:pyruvate kinase [Gorillibacterium massiliense]|uniref:pyruvate kinase n=1 Tax=Gorillibacterium massiliense TaxID=1280390 RepID=UPI0004B227CD|nr:pyruvate kinase [Gorillibacterium massiliense]
MRKTKIVCTIGPASESPDMLRKMMEAGMDVARLNVAHGGFEEHGARIDVIRAVSRQLGKTVAVMLDIKGPEVRIGAIRDGAVPLTPGAMITLTTDVVEGDAERVTVTYKDLPQDACKGTVILIDDGLIRLEVTEAGGSEVRCVVVNGGVLKSRKGVNIPGLHVNLPGVTERDVQFIRFGIEKRIDVIAASFVRKAADVMEIRSILEKENAGHIRIIAKIEDQEGVDNLDEILEAADGIMVARGDMGVNLNAEEVPPVQKMIIRKCNAAGKPVITATHMLESMQVNPRPSRAEATDVAGAVFDGSDAVMLSGESAAGKYPLESVKVMARIAERAEQGIVHTLGEPWSDPAYSSSTVSITEAVCRSAVHAATELRAAAIVAPTMSGFTARMAAKYRPECPVLAVSPDEKTLPGLCMVRGVIPLKGDEIEDTDHMIEMCEVRAVRAGYLNAGDLVVLVAGVPVGESAPTNLIKIHRIGE